MIDHRSVPEILPRPRPPADVPGSVDDARALADAAVEWARYYRCYRVEAWDRDLTTSCYLHAGTDQQMLFLEWQFFALLPIMPGFRAIDQYRDPLLAPLEGHRRGAAGAAGDRRAPGGARCSGGSSR